MFDKLLNFSNLFSHSLNTQIVHVPKPYPYKVEVPVEKIVEKVVKVPYDR